MRMYVSVLLMFALVMGCEDRSKEYEQKLADLQNQNNTLSQNLAARDKYIDDVTLAINEVYKDLESVRAKETKMVPEAEKIEKTKRLSSPEVREKFLREVSFIDSSLKKNRLRLNNLQAKLVGYEKQFAGLTKMVEDLKQSLAERDKSITDLQTRVTSLAQEVDEKTHLVAQKDSTIGQQQTVINTGFYAVGTKSTLKEKGIIADDGGFLWGLLGSTTILTNDANATYFNPIDKTQSHSIEVDGRIREIVPKRNGQYYSIKEVGEHRSVLEIVEPQSFWRNNYLAIITD